jgi:hypothetical protein
MTPPSIAYETAQAIRILSVLDGVEPDQVLHAAMRIIWEAERLRTLGYHLHLAVSDQAGNVYLVEQ